MFVMRCQPQLVCYNLPDEAATAVLAGHHVDPHEVLDGFLAVYHHRVLVLLRGRLMLHGLALLVRRRRRPSGRRRPAVAVRLLQHTRLNFA